MHIFDLYADVINVILTFVLKIDQRSFVMFSRTCKTSHVLCDNFLNMFVQNMLRHFDTPSDMGDLIKNDQIVFLNLFARDIIRAHPSLFEYNVLWAYRYGKMHTAKVLLQIGQEICNTSQREIRHQSFKIAVLTKNCVMLKSLLRDMREKNDIDGCIDVYDDIIKNHIAQSNRNEIFITMIDFAIDMRMSVQTDDHREDIAENQGFPENQMWGILIEVICKYIPIMFTCGSLLPAVEHFFSTCIIHQLPVVLDCTANKALMLAYHSRSVAMIKYCKIIFPDARVNLDDVSYDAGGYLSNDQFLEYLQQSGELNVAQAILGACAHRQIDKCVNLLAILDVDQCSDETLRSLIYSSCAVSKTTFFRVMGKIDTRDVKPDVRTMFLHSCTSLDFELFKWLQNQVIHARDYEELACKGFNKTSMFTPDETIETLLECPKVRRDCVKSALEKLSMITFRTKQHSNTPIDDVLQEYSSLKHHRRIPINRPIVKKLLDIMPEKITFALPVPILGQLLSFLIDLKKIDSSCGDIVFKSIIEEQDLDAIHLLIQRDVITLDRLKNMCDGLNAPDVYEYFAPEETHVN